MRSRMIRSLCALVAVAALAPDARAQQRPTADHPLVKAYAGSRIRGGSIKQFDEQTLVVGRSTTTPKDIKLQRLEGKVTIVEYDDPRDRSSLERMRNYELALRQGGFQVVYACGKEECGPETHIPTLGYYPRDRYMVAKLARPAGDVWVAVSVDAGPWTKLYVVESKPMETGMVKVTADALNNDITREGRAAVYGILFETGKADLKPESSEALKEIAALLQKNPAMRLHVVGHTDNVGTLASNMDLSARRAAAAVRALTTTYGIAAARLQSSGVGPLSPVASNKTEDGRAKNRRVELVEQ